MNSIKQEDKGIESRGEISNFFYLSLEELKLLANHKEDNDSRRQWRGGRRSMSTGNTRATRLHENMFLPPLEHPFFSKDCNISISWIASEYATAHLTETGGCFSQIEVEQRREQRVWHRMNTERH